MLGSPKIQTLRIAGDHPRSEMDALKNRHGPLFRSVRFHEIINTITAGEGDYAKLG